MNTQIIAVELAEAKARMRAALGSEHPFVGAVGERLVSLSGKMMRPVLGLLCGKLFEEQTSDKVYASVVLFELLHTATLVHDDVIDGAYLRRGEATLGAMLRSRSAVLAGDFLFAKGLNGAARAGAYKAIEAATEAIERVVDGELAQSDHARKGDTTVAEYYRVARLKTSALLSGVARAAAGEAGASADDLERMEALGAALGLAFQIQDDILDYEGQGTGKTCYNDIRERKFTLPLLLAIERGGNRAGVWSDMRKGQVEAVVGYVKKHEGVALARAAMEIEGNKALAILAHYPAGAVRDTLEAYARYVSNRNK